MSANNTLKIAMSGTTGFVGNNLSLALSAKGWEIIALGRQDFDLPSEQLAKKMEGAQVVINLAGAPIIKRWTKEYKQTLYDSRIIVTRKLVKACENMSTRPRLFISTSAIGYYAEEGTHTEEKHTPAQNFLGNLTREWEKEAAKAQELDIRTVIFRFGVVLGKDGGALKEMLLPFKLGIGGKIGDGRQPFSWIHMEDLIQAYFSAIDFPSYSGIYNLTSPNPTTNLGLTKALGKALFRPTFFRVPTCVLKFQYGEGARLLTGGQKVLPERLLESKFEFRFPTIDQALRDCVS
jgi:uncharacterized protein (TIGR01777 family)